MSDRNDIERGELARQIIDNPIWAETWASFQNEVREKWENTPAANAEEREMFYLMIRVARRVRSDVEEAYRTGQWALQEAEKAAGGK